MEAQSESTTTTSADELQPQTTVGTTLPQVYAFVMAASAAQADEQQAATDQSTIGRTNGAVRLEMVAGTVILQLLVTLGLIRSLF